MEVATSMRRAKVGRVVVLGGGIGGVAAVRWLERVLDPGVEIVLVSRDNFFVLPPLLFEACSGVLELRHCAQPIRPCLRRARYVEGTVQSVDTDRRTVLATSAGGARRQLAYDQLVVALGATTNLDLVPGTEHALTFKTAGDALLLRNHLIEQLERADAEPDPARRRSLMTVVIIGGGLVGVELMGEITAFLADEMRHYPRLRTAELHFHMFEVGPHLLAESAPRLRRYADRTMAERGVSVHTSAPVESITPGAVRWSGGSIEADTVILAAGIVPASASSAMDVARDRRGRILTDATMRSTSHPEVWALGDCAAVPGPDGRPYPALAQHAIREARTVAMNVAAALRGETPQAFAHRALGTMAAFGHQRAAADWRGVFVTGRLAWWIRRTYYMLQMPRWDTRLRMALDWTVALFFRPDLTKVDLVGERGGRTVPLSSRPARYGSPGAVPSR
jgi:NADH:quinone reductase (non-electrogenic)